MHDKPKHNQLFQKKIPNITGKQFLFLKALNSGHVLL